MIKTMNHHIYNANNFYGWAMSQKLPLNGFKWVKQTKLSKFNEDCIKKYDENSNTGYFLEVRVEYPKELFTFHKDLRFLSERKKVEKVEKLICSIEGKEKYLTHIRAFIINHNPLRFRKNLFNIYNENHDN